MEKQTALIKHEAASVTTVRAVLFLGFDPRREHSDTFDTNICMDVLSDDLQYGRTPPGVTFSRASTNKIMLISYFVIGLFIALLWKLYVQQNKIPPGDLDTRQIPVIVVLWPLFLVYLAFKSLS